MMERIRLYADDNPILVWMVQTGAVLSFFLLLANTSHAPETKAVLPLLGLSMGYLVPTIALLARFTEERCRIRPVTQRDFAAVGNLAFFLAIGGFLGSMALCLLGSSYKQSHSDQIVLLTVGVAFFPSLFAIPMGLVSRVVKQGKWALIVSSVWFLVAAVWMSRTSQTVEPVNFLNHPETQSAHISQQ